MFNTILVPNAVPRQLATKPMFLLFLRVWGGGGWLKKKSLAKACNARWYKKAQKNTVAPRWRDFLVVGLYYINIYI